MIYNLTDKSGGGQNLTNVVTETLLWTNPNLSVTFTAQTINLDLSGYDSIKIVVRVNTSSSGFTTTEVKINKWNDLIFCDAKGVISSNLTITSRNASVSATGVTFGDNKFKTSASATENVNNNYNIPYQIYGVKYQTALDKGIILDDFVIERGKTGNWNYTKWNSGKYEATCRVRKVYNITQSLGNGWYLALWDTESLPNDLTMVEHISLQVEMDAGTVYATIGQVTTTSVRYSVNKLGSLSNAGGYLIIKVEGTWK